MSVVGLPQPTVLLDLPQPALALGADAENVYVAGGGGSGVDVLPKTPPGGAGKTLGDAILVESLAPGNGGVIVASADDSIQRLGLDGTVTVLAQGQTGAGFSDQGAVAVDASHVYWLGDGPSAGKGATPTMGFVRQSDPDGSNVVELASGQTQPRSIVVDGGFVYWAESGSLSSEGDPQPDGALHRVPVGGGAAETLATGLLEPTVLGPRGADLWFGANGGLFRVPDGGGMPDRVFSSDEGAVLGVSHAYVVITFGGERLLLRVPLDGGCAEPIADLGLSATTLGEITMAADDSRVYVSLAIGPVVSVAQ
jgi:hypothetical protein